MTRAPSRIWICAQGKELPEWVVEHMTTGAIADDGSFEIEAADGPVKVERGFAIFECEGQVFACQPRMVPEKLKAVAGGHPVVEELQRKTATMAAQHAAQRHTAKRAAAAKGSGTPRESLRIKPAIGEPPTPAFVGVERLEIDDSYQRSIEGGASQKLIHKIAENWDWRLCLPLLVSRRNGQMYVIDGQHRLEAARLRGDIPHMPVVVFDFDDPKAEAELFVQANRSRRSMGKLDDFHAAIVAGDKKALAVNEVVTAAGLVVGRNFAWQYWKPGEVVFVSAVERALKIQGKEIAQRALATMAKAFDGMVMTGGGSIFDGLCNLLHDGEKAGQPIDLELMQIVLAETGIPGWKEAVEGIDGGAERAEVMRRALRTAYAEAGDQ
jgi:hypothetical protein